MNTDKKNMSEIGLTIVGDGASSAPDGADFVRISIPTAHAVG
jgi:hypothetical protein